MSDPLVAGFDVLLLDLDGVVYRGPEAVPHAVDVLTDVVRTGVRLGYVTNNASRTPGAVAEQLRDLGLDAHATDVVTSAQAGARLLADLLPGGARVLVIGGDGVTAALDEVGLVPVTSASQAPQAVLQGFSPDLGWRQLAEGAYAVGRGLPWVATNTDLTIPTAGGIAPGNGTLVQAVATATGRSPVVAGKPERPLMDESVRRLAARRPLVVGDRLDTDIEGARTAGLASLLVLTGVTDVHDLLVAPAGRRPDFVGDDLRALCEAYPRVEAASSTWTCQGWAVERDGEALRMSSLGTRPVDGVRALVAACAVLTDSGVAPELVRSAAEPALAAVQRSG
jgi:HAD superfamily hydrolase (TIGR01450 family)